ncbi:MAG: hypothetical protein KAJ34_07290, partial [Thermodesulfovibrionia bacterium]|nr:hypothetical protein [Thermodesulfovibrionia bacterium]
MIQTAWKTPSLKSCLTSILFSNNSIALMLPSKKEVSKLLKEKKYGELIELSLNNKKILSILISLSYDKKNPISWRAIQSTGLITGKMSKSNPKLVRNVAGRLLWMIRDESGGIGWSAPEILGEIVRNCPILCS